MNLQFTKQIEIKPSKNTKYYFIVYWIIFFVISLCVGFYTSCDYQSAIYTKGSCNKVLLTAGQDYPMRSNETIFIKPLIDIKWDGRNSIYYNCYSNITFVQIDISTQIKADISFRGVFICNDKPWLTLSETTISNSPTWMQYFVNNSYSYIELNNNFTKPYSILIDIENKIQTVYDIESINNITFNTDIFNVISEYTKSINNLDVVTSYQCRSCYGHMETFSFQSFVRLIITMGTIFSFATMISTKIIPIILDYKYYEINEMEIDHFENKN